MVSISRLSALLIAVASAAVLVFVLPGQVEPFPYGAIKPVTVPFAALLVMAVSAGAMVLEPDMKLRIERSFLGRLLLIVIMTVSAVLALQFIAFEYSMPVFALVIMLLAGERRILWLGLGSGIPIAVWAIAELALGRPLP